MQNNKSKVILIYEYNFVMLYIRILWGLSSLVPFQIID